MSERILSVGGNRASRPIDDFLFEKTKIWYVGPNEKDDGDDGRSGRSRETSLATLDEAIDRAVASTTSYNDIIYVLPNHGETISTAGQINLDKIGLRVIGLGTGAYRPTFTFSATDATILMSAASCSFEDMILVPSIDSVVSGIVVSAADCKVDIEVQDTADIEFVTAVLTTADVDRIDINLKYIGDAVTGNACVAPIQLVGVDTARIYVDFYGKASTAVVNFITTACTNIDIKGYFHNVGTALTKNVVDTVTGSTWSVRGWDGVNNAKFSGGDNAVLASDDTTMGKVANRAAADVFDGTQTALFTIAGGRVLIKGIIGEVSGAAVNSSASATSFVTNPTVGTDMAMCATLDINGNELGTIYSITGVVTDALAGGSGGGAMFTDRGIVVPEGTIDLLSAADVGIGGALGSFDIWWLPLDEGATLVST